MATDFSGSVSNVAHGLNRRKTGRTQSARQFVQPSLLCGAATAGGDFADLVDEHCALQRIDFEQEWSDLRDERIGEHILRDVARVCEELGQMHLERIGEPL